MALLDGVAENPSLEELLLTRLASLPLHGDSEVRRVLAPGGQDE